MRLNELSFSRGSRSPKRRVGRGAGSDLVRLLGEVRRGQKARSGGGVRPGFEGGQYLANAYSKIWIRSE